MRIQYEMDCQVLVSSKVVGFERLRQTTTAFSFLLTSRILSKRPISSLAKRQKRGCCKSQSKEQGRHTRTRLGAFLILRRHSSLRSLTQRYYDQAWLFIVRRLFLLHKLTFFESPSSRLISKPGRSSRSSFLMNKPTFPFLKGDKDCHFEGPPSATINLSSNYRVADPLSSSETLFSRSASKVVRLNRRRMTHDGLLWAGTCCWVPPSSNWLLLVARRSSGSQSLFALISIGIAVGYVDSTVSECTNTGLRELKQA